MTLNLKLQMMHSFLEGLVKGISTILQKLILEERCVEVNTSEY